MTFNPTRMSRWMALIWLLVGLGLIGWMVYLCFQDQAFARMAQSVKGTVIDLEQVAGDDGPTYAPIVKFVTESGQTMRFSSNASASPPAYQVGNVVDVLYDPQNPNHAQIMGGMNTMYLFFSAFGLLFASFGGISLARYTSPRRGLRTNAYHPVTEPAIIPETLTPNRKLLKKFTLNQTSDGIQIRSRVRNKMSYFWLCIAIFAVVFTALFNSGRVQSYFLIFPIYPGTKEMLLSVLFLVIFDAVLGYFVLREFVNHTTALLASKQIEISHGPLPSLIPESVVGAITQILRVVRSGDVAMIEHRSRNQVINLDEIKRVYWKRRVALTVNNSPVWYAFDVWIEKKTGADVLLIKGFDSDDQANFIQQWIEHWL